MNTERPDHDDAEASGGPRNTEPGDGTPTGDSETTQAPSAALEATAGGAAEASTGTSAAPGAQDGEATGPKATREAPGDGDDAEPEAAGPRAARGTAGAEATGPDGLRTDSDSAVLTPQTEAQAPGTDAAEAEAGHRKADDQPAAPELGRLGTDSADGVPSAETKTPSTHAPEAEAGHRTADDQPAAPELGRTGTDSAVGADGVPSVDAEAEVAGAGREVPEVARGFDGEDARSGRRRSVALVASVAAAVLLVGGGGAYLAAHAGGGSGGSSGSGAPGGGGTPPPLALDGYASASGGTNGIAPGEPNPYGVTYEASGKLPDGPGSAAVYRPAGEVTKDEVARLAEAFGIDGTPVAEGQTWRVGPDKDGSGPSLQVNRQAPGSWTFSRYAPGTDNCKSTLVCTQDPGAPAGDPVSVAAAQKAAAPILKALGQDDAKADASQVMGAQRVVNADPVVGGLPTYGWTTGLTVGRQGEVIGGYGLLKTPVKGDTYPVLSARKTLDLMNSAPRTDARMGIGGCATPVPLKDRLEQPCSASTSTSAPTSPLSATPTPAQDPSTVTVDRAVFGLASHSVEGRQALVPSWLFEVTGSQARGSFTVTYPAVDPKYLTSSAPATEPTSPGGEPSSAPKTRDVHVDGYTAGDKELTVSFMGGVCADYTASADESADRVTVTVTEKPWPNKICIMIAKQFQQTVQLDEPLGTRKVVGSDGQEIPLRKPGARLPQPSSATR
ncbi:hypothetical protein ACFY1J_08010 [Streptomyces sp. NPDC001406]|uniref:hypothetical protein n=1 Tax=Streptomyces sp. NPDC001406 TaxID=3364572 RepID=UPI0036A3E3BA